MPFFCLKLPVMKGKEKIKFEHHNQTLRGYIHLLWSACRKLELWKRDGCSKTLIYINLF